MKPKSQHHIVRYLFEFALVALLVGLAVNYQSVLDCYALLTFHPSSDMVTIEGQLDLTSAARGQFYRTQPQLDAKADFNRDCDTQAQELELGCYYRGRIYVLRIDNASLASEMDVVTAHELLHAEWDRMSEGERIAIGAELERVYAQLADADLKQRMADYAKSEPGEQDNELHSILGTEYSNLSPLLEEHYAKYLANRARIVAAHATFEGVFNDRRSELATELAQIRAQKAQLGILNHELDSYRSSGRIANYNALVPRQNALVDDINQRVTTYQAGVEEYNALSKSLDSQEITDTETPAQ